jgi:hypothetical protein
MWVVSFPSLIMSLITMASVRNWASLTTNRVLLANLLRVYVFAFTLIFIFTLWLICAMFLTFKVVDDWTVIVILPLLGLPVLIYCIFISSFLTTCLHRLSVCLCFLLGGYHNYAYVSVLCVYDHIPPPVHRSAGVLHLGDIVLHRQSGHGREHHGTRPAGECHGPERRLSVSVLHLCVRHAVHPGHPVHGPGARSGQGVRQAL